jgi:Putative DNA-binding domain
MHTLPELQLCVMDALLGRSDGASAAALLRPGTALQASRRLQIYRNNLFESLGAALAAVYPVVQQLVGSGFFRHLARSFIGAHPSRSGNLHRFGAELPQFLRRFEPAASLPYLPDVASLEWAYHHAYHEAERPALSAARLAEVPGDDQAELRLRVQPSAAFVASPFPVLRIWQANQPQAPEDAAVSLDEGGVALMVVQREMEIEFRLLGVAEHCWLRALHSGAGLGAATQQALDEDPAFDLGAALLRHLEHGLFVGFDAAATVHAAYPDRGEP